MGISIGSGKGPKGEINVTPLVDVCLVLLIIFMVITPMLHQGVEVNLPQGPHAEEKPGERTDLVISIKDDGSLFVDLNWISDGDLAAWLRSEHVKNPDRTVVLKADARIHFGRVREVMKSANEAEFRRVAILTERPQPNGGGS
jgi:biopolymer transport protein TolR